MLLASCKSIPIKDNTQTPETDFSGKLPLNTTAMVYAAVPYADKDSKNITREVLERNLAGAVLLHETDIEVAKKYFANASNLTPDKKASLFIFFTSDLYIDGVQVVAFVRGIVYNGKGKAIYESRAQGAHLRSGLNNKANFKKAMVKAQMAFYDELFNLFPTTIRKTAEQKPTLAKKIISGFNKDKIRDITTASGFIINNHGDALTNYHAIRDCLNVELHLGKTTSHAQIQYIDEKDDLALLASNITPKNLASFAGRKLSPRLGDDVIVMGFPLQGVLSSSPSLTTGNISAMAGVKNNESVYQITAPVQQGNSGGPVLNNSGAVVAVVQSKLNAVTVANYTGDIPQNVNFAIKNNVIKNFLRTNQIKYTTLNKFKKLSTADIAETASSYTVEVSCKGYVDTFRAVR